MRYETLKLEAWDKSACWPKKIQPGEQIYIFAIFRRTEASSWRRRRWTDPVREH
jgi:hypothetical protein